MTSKEALEVITTLVEEYSPVKLVRHSRDYKMLNDLVERDTPKKPIVNIVNEIKEYNCGVCLCRLDIPQLKEVNFCPKCGNRIDWS